MNRLRVSVLFLFVLFGLLNFPLGIIAQEEYASKNVIVGQQITENVVFQTTVPLSMDANCSKIEMVFSPSEIGLSAGDMLTGISFKGYNLGMEKILHISVWMVQEGNHSLPQQFTPLRFLNKVFDGDCHILQGGTTEETINLLSIDFDQWQIFDGMLSTRIIIACEDGKAGDVINFVAEENGRCLCATGDETSAFETPHIDKRPLTTFKVATPVKYVSGTIFDGNGNGVEGATVSLLRYGSEDMTTTATSDAEGHYRVRLEDGSARYTLHATAPGHTAFEDDADFEVKDNPVKDYTLYGNMSYPADKRSTIILPVAPDASAGRYYALSRREGRTFIFQRVLTPEANVPYVLFADRNYYVDLSTMDLSVEPHNTILDDSLSFVGTYTNGNYLYSMSSILSDIDEGGAPCKAMHAQLVGHWMLMAGDDHKLVFSDDISAISTKEYSIDTGNHHLFDLQGRRLTTQPRRGIYVKDGKKVVVK